MIGNHERWERATARQQRLKCQKFGGVGTTPHLLLVDITQLELIA